MPKGVYERKMADFICEACGRTYQSTVCGNNKKRFCPDCRPDAHRKMLRESTIQKKEKIHAFRRSLGLD